MDEQVSVNTKYLSESIDTSIKCLSTEEILEGFQRGMLENCVYPSDALIRQILIKELESQTLDKNEQKWK